MVDQTGVVPVVHLGSVCDRVAFFRKPVRRHSAKSEFDVAAIKELPRIDVGASADVCYESSQSRARSPSRPEAGSLARGPRWWPTSR